MVVVAVASFVLLGQRAAVFGLYRCRFFVHGGKVMSFFRILARMDSFRDNYVAHGDGRLQKNAQISQVLVLKRVHFGFPWLVFPLSPCLKIGL